MVLITKLKAFSTVDRNAEILCTFVEISALLLLRSRDCESLEKNLRSPGKVIQISWTMSLVPIASSLKIISRKRCGKLVCAIFRTE